MISGEQIVAHLLGLNDRAIRVRKIHVRAVFTDRPQLTQGPRYALCDAKTSTARRLVDGQFAFSREITARPAPTHLRNETQQVRGSGSRRSAHPTKWRD